MKRIIILSMVLLLPVLSLSTVRVVTSLPDLADIAQRIGRDRVKVDFIVQGDQNPHYVEVKPSYMMKLKSADIFFIIGMELEIWAPQLVDGSRNSSLLVVDLSRDIKKLEVPMRLDASAGDVHRYGNPHYWLDPRNIRIVADEMVEALARVSPGDEQFFRANAEAYIKVIDGKIAEWETLMKPFAGKKIVTFHQSWSYLAAWTGLEVAGQVEPKPGIPPSPTHTTELLTLMRQAKIKVIVVEPFYDATAPEQIARSSDAKVLRLSTSVGGVSEAKDYITLMEYNLQSLAAALR